MLIKSDATVLGRYVDGVIYILEAEKTTRRDVNETVDVLKKADVRLLGVVLNKYGREKEIPILSQGTWQEKDIQKNISCHVLDDVDYMFGVY